jgi:hypothetical protein
MDGTCHEYRVPGLAVLYLAPVVHPALSLVLELDNVRLSGLARLWAACDQFGQQLREVVDIPPACWPTAPGFGAEVLVTYNPGEVPDADAQLALERILLAASGAAAGRLVPLPGGTYYQLKDAGAAEAAGDYIVFCDSDAVPEPGWLRTLLDAAWAGPVVAGSTYIEPVGLYGQAFALFWMFPTRKASDDVRPVKYFWANNVLFERETFLRFRFGSSKAYRGRCGVLADRLRAAGVSIHEASGARTAHPPPNGLRAYVGRALVTGADDRLFHRWGGGPGPFRLLRKRLRASARAFRSRPEREAVGLATAASVPAFAIAAGFWSLAFTGWVLSVTGRRGRQLCAAWA